MDIVELEELKENDVVVCRTNKFTHPPYSLEIMEEGYEVLVGKPFKVAGTTIYTLKIPDRLLPLYQNGQEMLKNFDVVHIDTEKKQKIIPYFKRVV